MQRLRGLNEKFSAISERINYRGETFLQSRVFLIGVSLFISILLWAFVALDGNSDAARTVTAEIKYLNTPRGLSVYAPSKKVEVKLVGKISSLSNVQAADVIAAVDLASLTPGKYNLPIRIEVPSFARIRSWQPSLAQVEIYRHIEKRMLITVSTTGTPPEGMVVSSIDASPARAVISGPEEDVMQVTDLEAVVPLDKLNSNSEFTAPVEIKNTAAVIPGDSAASRLSVSPREVKVKISYENEIVGERIPVRVSVVGQPQEGLQVESVRVIPDTVAIRGNSTAVRKMQSLVLPPVDISGLEQNIQLMLPMQPAKLDPGIDITGTDRARVEITLSKKMGSRVFNGIQLAIEGNEPTREWKLSPQTVSITVEGPQVEAETLSAAHPPCELYVDLSNIVAKQTELPVLVRGLKRDFRVVKIEPEQVLVTAVQ